MSQLTHTTPILSPILGAYITRRFAFWVAGAFLMVGFVIYLIELVDALRRATSIAEMSFADVALLASFRVPSFVELAAPILIVVAALGCFWWMTRSHEFTVVRSTGTSFFQFARPMFLLSGLLGVLIVAFVSPISIILNAQYESVLSKFSGGAQSAQLTVASTQSGLWIADELSDGRRVILKAGGRATGTQVNLRNVDLFELDDEGALLENLTASQALISENGLLTLLGIERIEEDGTSSELPDRSYQTALNLEAVQAAERQARLPTFWNLLLERIAQSEGNEEFKFDASEQRLALLWHKFLAFPLLLLVSVALAAVFSLRMSRKGKTGLLIGIALACAIAFQIVRELLFAAGLSGRIPAPIAIWAPIFAVAAISFFTLSINEDG